MPLALSGSREDTLGDALGLGLRQLQQHGDFGVDIAAIQLLLLQYPEAEERLERFRATEVAAAAKLWMLPQQDRLLGELHREVIQQLREQEAGV
jgi:hypothetical protein